MRKGGYLSVDAVQKWGGALSVAGGGVPGHGRPLAASRKGIPQNGNTILAEMAGFPRAETLSGQLTTLSAAPAGRAS